MWMNWVEYLSLFRRTTIRKLFALKILWLWSLAWTLILSPYYTKLDIHRHSASVWKIGSPERELWVFHLKIHFALQNQWIWNQMVPIKFGLEKEIIMFSNIFHSSLIIHRLVISQSQFASVISLSCHLCYLRSTQLINYVYRSEMESRVRVLDATGNSSTGELCHGRWH